MISPPERARLLDAEMQLQRAWLELNLRELSAAARRSPWSRLHSLSFGRVGLLLLRYRSVWLALASVLLNMYRRHARKEKS